MGTSIENILSEMEEVLDKSMAVPFSGKKSLIDVEKMSSLIYEMRSNLPQAFEEARSVARDRKQIMADAQSEADKIIRKAGERAKQMVATQEIVRLSEAKAQQVTEDAHQYSKKIRHTANDFVDDMLGKAEDSFTRNLTEIKRVRAAMKNSVKTT
jgi:F0F1-type ATP synthase membrane subunit b/b'